MFSTVLTLPSKFQPSLTLLIIFNVFSLGKIQQECLHKIIQASNQCKPYLMQFPFLLSSVDSSWILLNLPQPTWRNRTFKPSKHPSPLYVYMSRSNTCNIQTLKHVWLSATLARGRFTFSRLLLDLGWKEEQAFWVSERPSNWLKPQQRGRSIHV
jgi:hypothetical protein